MATLEVIRGGGGTIRVGTVGTISTLMTRELESSSPQSLRQTPVRAPHDKGPVKLRKSVEEASRSGGSSMSSGTTQGSPVFMRKGRGQDPHRVSSLSTTSATKAEPNTPLEDVGNSTIRQAISKNGPCPDYSGKPRSHKRSYRIPMLGSENMHLEKTPIRDKPMKKLTSIVDIVDIHCGNPGGSLSRLKKLGFSKLSQSFI